MRRLIWVVGLLVVGGCSAVPSILTHPLTQEAAIKESGGPFTATYSGTYTLGEGCARTQFHFNGSGTGSFIHSSTESGTMISSDVGCNWGGHATLTSSTRPRNSITVALSLGNFGFSTPCSPRLGQKVHFKVTSGTGRFSNATGNGTVVFSCHSDGTYTDTWSGAITF
jgi:hypothetical protein